ncbi:MAG: nodulation protein NfeD [Candidatus Omnitrophica bacterium]|nr:nodulation protein NfeD [Candidatus Omnitrophota bacterium]
MRIIALTAVIFVLAASPCVLPAQEPPVESLDRPIVFFIPFEGEVEIGLSKVLQRGFEEAEQQRATYIFLEMDTPGGRVDAALDIVDLILNSKIPVAIYVTNGATSAGAIISLAADQVFMSGKNLSTIGTASPVLGGGAEASDTMEAKALSYVLAKVRAICEERGYSDRKTELAMAMVDKEMEITDPDNPDKLLTTKGTPLTFTAQEALKYGFITGIVNSREEALQTLGLENARQINRVEHVSERIARFFSSMTISSLLLTVAFLGIFIEFRSPGFGIPGLVGIIALILFFWGHQIAGLAGFEGPTLFMIGLILLVVELFVIPGFGLTGILGILCIMASVVITLLEHSITSPHFSHMVGWSDVFSALGITLTTMLIGATGAMLVPFLIPAAANTPFGSWLSLKTREDKSLGYHSAEDNLDQFLGKVGIARTKLRPAGIAEIEGRRLDVVSQGGFIENNSPVKVIKVEGRRIVVQSQ